MFQISALLSASHARIRFSRENMAGVEPKQICCHGRVFEVHLYLLACIATSC